MGGHGHSRGHLGQFRPLPPTLEHLWPEGTACGAGGEPPGERHPNQKGRELVVDTQHPPPGGPPLRTASESPRRRSCLTSSRSLPFLPSWSLLPAPCCICWHPLHTNCVPQTFVQGLRQGPRRRHQRSPLVATLGNVSHRVFLDRGSPRLPSSFNSASGGPASRSRDEVCWKPLFPQWVPRTLGPMGAPRAAWPEPQHTASQRWPTGQQGGLCDLGARGSPSELVQETLLSADGCRPLSQNPCFLVARSSWRD